MQHLVLVLSFVAVAFCAYSIGPLSASQLNVNPGGCNPGQKVEGGFAISMPGQHNAATASVQGTISVQLLCNLQYVSQLNIAVSGSGYSWGAQGDGGAAPVWLPTGDQSATTSFQGSANCPSSGCNGVFSFGTATFTANVLSSNVEDVFALKFHYGVDSRVTGSSIWSDPLNGYSQNPSCEIASSDPCAFGCQCNTFKVVDIAGPGLNQQQTNVEVYSPPNPTGVADPNCAGSNCITTITFRMITRDSPECQNGMSYIAIGIAGLDVVYPPNGGTWKSPAELMLTYSILYTSTSGNPGFTSIKYAPNGGASQFCCGKYETFVLQVRNYPRNHQWTLQAHIGGFYETYTSVSYSGCTCPQGGCPPPAPLCPAGYSGADCKDCDPEPAPGLDWVCVADVDTPGYYYLILATSQDVQQYVTDGTGFVPGQTDLQGFRTNCDCSRIPPDCTALNNCNGHGSCQPDDTCKCVAGYNGTSCQFYDCSNPPPTPSAEFTAACDACASGCSTPPTAPPVCQNLNGCSGHGTCVDNACVCETSATIVYTGNDCSTSYVPFEGPPPCGYWETCDECSAAACSWCLSGGAAACVPNDLCSTGNAQTICGEGSVGYVPPTDTCPVDDEGRNCSGKGDCLQNQNGYYCDCNSGRGIDCAGGGLSVAAKAGIAAGVIAAIVIACVVAVVIATVGGVKGYQYLTAQDLGMQAASQNPLHEPRDTEVTSAVYSAPHD